MKGSVGLIAAIFLLTGASLFLSIKPDAKAAGDGQKIDAHALEAIVGSASKNQNFNLRESSGIQAPGFTLKTTDGETVTIGGKKGKPTLIQFWASWCEACRVEAPTLQKLHERYQESVDFYGINVTSEEKDPDKIAEFWKLNELSFPVLLDENKRAGYLYELHALPTTFLIDADGYVVDTFHMADPLEFDSKIQLLAGK
jgi:thiol-disulfide isomerase/thioredoxin